MSAQRTAGVQVPRCVGWFESKSPVSTWICPEEGQVTYAEGQVSHWSSRLPDWTGSAVAAVHGCVPGHTRITGSPVHTP